MAQENEKIKAADSILIVGGGPTGVELAAEIAVDFPQKKVTLVHDGSRLLEFIGPKVSDKTLEWLKNKNVEVKLMQSVDMSNNTNNSGGNKTYFTTSGEAIRADCHFLCTGKSPGSEWLRETYLKDRIDNFGRLKVDENLRIIFAVGDISDIKVIIKLFFMNLLDNIAVARGPEAAS
ncbi:hypothetical protein KY284_008574 [Solanum tuberosum]|nr:hypothetical protein KY284_008574 [Solanum tuberosum]